MQPPRVEETIWIELSDGCRLAARLWLPAEDKCPAPAILEYLPYRRRDRHRGDDAILHPAFAASGYAAIRVDMRGSGDSDGLMTDEYTHREWEDAVEVIGWIARQPWCSGAVGMIGLSWSGFNSLQVAALAPPALKAIVTTCASDDRYADDMHYMGGRLLNDNLQYGSTLLTGLAMPPDPLIVGERWRDMWLERLGAIEIPPAGRWMQHADRDAYWKSGSVCEDYTRIRAAVLVVGGWADGYTNAVLRLLEGLSGPKKGLIGPWGHAFPHVAIPGPQVNFIDYVIRWWDQWLKGRDTGIMQEPMLTCWMQEHEPPRAYFPARRGHWVAESAWPSSAVEVRSLPLTTSGLGREGLPPDATVCSPATVGLASGEWCPYGWGPDMPLDQRGDDAGSMCFDGLPLDSPVEILGGIRLALNVSSDNSEAMLAARLCDVAPDGTSTRITYGLLNLQHRSGHGQAELLTLGQRYAVKLRLKDVAYQVPAGHRLRLAISTVYWPLAAPLPALVTVHIHTGELRLPVRNGLSAAKPAELGEAWSPPVLAGNVIVPPRRGRLRIEHDLENEMTKVEVVRSLGARRLEEVDLELGSLGSETYSVSKGDPSTARAEARRTAELRRHDWHISVQTHSVLTAVGDDWRLEATIEAADDGKRVFGRTWDLRVPRSTAKPRRVD